MTTAGDSTDIYALMDSPKVLLGALEGLGITLLAMEELLDLRGYKGKNGVSTIGID